MEMDGIAPSTRLQARSAESTANSAENIPDSEEPVALQANDHPEPRLEDTLEQSAHIIAAHLNAQIKDVGELLA